MGRSNWAGACALVVVLAAMPAARGDDAAEAEGSPFDGGREAAEAEDGPFDFGSAAASEVGHGPAYAARKIEWILDQPLKSPLQYPETPLNTVTGIISEEYELPIVFDTTALDAIAVSPEVEVTVGLANVTLRSALELMLRQVEDLTFIVDEEVLLITTEDEANTRLEVRVYRVDDLLHDAGAGSGQEIDEDQFDALQQIIVSTVESDSWMEHGTGEGEILQFGRGMFVVGQTHRVHEQIVKLLAEMRRVKVEIEASGSGEATAQKPVTRGFRVPAKEFTEAESSRDLLRNAILRAVEWDVEGTDLGDDEVFLEVLPNHVLVRHLPGVVRDVERVLEKWGAAPDEDIQPRGGGMGGSGGGRGGRGGGGRGGF
jgi:hypothetical protein